MDIASRTIPITDDGPLTEDFEEIFREHYQFVYRSAYRVTGNRQDAEDVLQNIFLRLLERRLPSALMRNPRAYLYRSAVNLAITALRARKRQRLTNGVETLELVTQESSPAPEEHIRRRLHEAFSRMNPRAVEMLVLRYEHNYSDAQIAEMLGKSRGTVAVTLNRARARLKKLFDASSGGKS
jgi:RNA polymerase sigma-70 factor (ECF subfamily)